MKKICVLTGAGISAESGIQTFRDAGGLWEGHDVMRVASIDGWRKNMSLVLDFYNKRRAQLDEVAPNEAHRQLARLQDIHEVVVITQNVDDLHERAGSRNVIHLHGELRKMRSSVDPSLIFPCEGDILPGQTCPLGSQFRPHIVWFGEEVPMLYEAIREIETSDIFFIVGTSLQVYPAAGLVEYVPRSCPIYYIDPNPARSYELSAAVNLKIFKGPAGIKVKEAIADMLITS